MTIKVTVYLKSNPTRTASIEYPTRTLDDVCEQYRQFLLLDSGIITHRGTKSIQIIDRTDVSSVDIRPIDRVQDDIDDAHKRAKKANGLPKKRLPDDY